MLFESASYRFTPRFDVLDVRFSRADRAQLDKIANDWRGVQPSASDRRRSLRSAADRGTQSRRIRRQLRAVAGARRSGCQVSGRALSIDPVARDDRRPRRRRAAGDGQGPREPRAQPPRRHRDRRSAHRRCRRPHGEDGGRRRAGRDRRDAGSATACRAHCRDARRSAPHAKRDIDIEQLQPGTAWLAPAEDEIPSIPSMRIVVQHLPARRSSSDQRRRRQPAQLRRRRDQRGEDREREPLARRRPARRRQRARRDRSRRRRRRAAAPDAHGALRRRRGARRDRARSLEARRRRPHAPGDRAAHVRFSTASRRVPARRARSASIRRIARGGKSNRRTTTRSSPRARASRSSASTPMASRSSSWSRRRKPAPPSCACASTSARARNQGVAGAAGARLDPGRHRRRHGGVQHDHRQHGDRGDADREEGYRAGRPRRVLRQGPHQGRIPADRWPTTRRASTKSRTTRLQGVVEPDRYYTAVRRRHRAALRGGDLAASCTSRSSAASSSRCSATSTLASRVTELTRYNRSFSGLQADFAGERFGYSASRPHRQGLCRTSCRATAPPACIACRAARSSSAATRCASKCATASQRVVVETRPLSRFIDYDLDYERGTLFFKEPVPSRDQDLNPVFIVADYEVRTGGEAQRRPAVAPRPSSRTTASRSARAPCRKARRRATAGSSARTCVGGSAPRPRCAPKWRAASRTIRCGPRAPMRGSSKASTSPNGSKRAPGRASRRRLRRGPAAGSETGTRKAGVDARYKLTERFTVEGETYQQKCSRATRSACSPAPRCAAMPTATRRRRRAPRRGHGPPSGETESHQAFVNGSVDLWEGRMTLRASQDARSAARTRASTTRRAACSASTTTVVRARLCSPSTNTPTATSSMPTRRASACARVRGSARSCSRASTSSDGVSVRARSRTSA